MMTSFHQNYFFTFGCISTPDIGIWPINNFPVLDAAIANIFDYQKQILLPSVL